MPKETNFQTSVKPTWCPGCGNFGIWAAIKKALVELGLEPYQVAMVFDIGCCGNSTNWYQVYGFHSLHGRTLPVAYAINLTNHNLKVIALAGDGGGYGEGGNHFIHTCRGNPDITFLVCNNQLYSLTTGQASPTTDKGSKTKTTPDGLIEVPFNPLQTAIIAGATFVARGFADDISHLTELIKQAIEHKGFALVDILQPCITLNKINTRDWYQEKIYKLKNESYQPKTKKEALIKAGEWEERIPVGIFWQENKPTYADNLPQIKEKPLVEQKIKKINITPFLAEFQ